MKQKCLTIGLAFLNKDYYPEKKKKERNSIDKIAAIGFVFKPICTRGWLISLKNHLSKRTYDVLWKPLRSVNMLS